MCGHPVTAPSPCLLPSSPTGVLRSTSRASGVWVPSNCSQPVPPPVTPTGVLQSPSPSLLPSPPLGSFSLPARASSRHPPLGSFGLPARASSRHPHWGPSVSQPVPPPVIPPWVLRSPSLCLLPSPPLGSFGPPARASSRHPPGPSVSQPAPPPVTPRVLRPTSRASGVWAPSVALVSSLMPKLAITQLCLTLCDPMDCSPPGSSIHGIFQSRIQEWVAISFLYGIFLAQGLNLGLLHCRQILYFLS